MLPKFSLSVVESLEFCGQINMPQFAGIKDKFNIFVGFAENLWHKYYYSGIATDNPHRHGVGTLIKNNLKTSEM